MKDKKIITIYILLIIYILLNNYVLSTELIKYHNIITSVALFIITTITYLLLSQGERRIRYKYEKNQNIIIIIVMYLIIYFLSGLIFGYEYSIYKSDSLSIIKNICFFTIPIILEELVRSKLVTNTKNNIINNTVISLIFTFTSFSIIKMLSNMSMFTLGFKYFTTEFIPILITSFVGTHLSRISGKCSVIIYRSILRLIPVILPILPSIPWILSGIIGITLPTIIYINISYFDMLYDRKERRFSLSDKKGDIPLLIFTIIFILFVLKTFKYYPVAVLSNSMNPMFSKGDSIIVEKIDKTSLENLQVYDIIYYRKNNRYIIHRIVEIKEENGKRIFITKGDNNQEKDSWNVYEEEIIGIMKFNVPYLGYPAVWFKEGIN